MSKKKAENLATKKELREKDIAFYMEIWEERPHICENCNVRINEPRTYNFDHILEKSKHKELRHEKENIWILCMECHTRKTNCYYVGKMEEKIKETRQKYLGY